MKKHRKYVYMVMIFLAIMVVGAVKKALQNDTFYTIKIGELILNNGIDMLDHFSFHQGLSYTYPHWLYDIFIYLIYRHFGYTGIYISTMILFFILLALVFKINRKLCHNDLISAFVTFICALAIAGFATARAQLVSYILFALEIYFIELFLKSGKKKYLGGLVLISLLLCNIHVAVWPFYFILYLPYLAEYVITKIVKRIKLKKKHKFLNYLGRKIVLEDNPNIKYLFITMILSLGTGLITPIGDTPYTYLFKTMAGNSQKYIAEHQGISWASSPFTIIVAIETVFLAFFSKAKLRDIFLIMGLIVMNVCSIRHLALLALLGTICFGRIFGMFIENFDFNMKPFNKFFKNKIVISVMFIGISLFTGLLLYFQKDTDYVIPQLFPVEAVKYIKENVDISEMRVFNDYDFGSYLILEDIPVFIDSRADLYTKQFSGFDYDIFDDYEYMVLNYQKKFGDYKITHVLMYKKYESFYNLLLKDENFELLYEDEDFGFFKKIKDADFIITYNGGTNIKLTPNKNTVKEKKK